MNVYELLENIASGVLQGHAIGDRLFNETLPELEVTSVIPEKEAEYQDITRLVRMANTGLLKLYTTFNLLEKELLLCTDPCQTMYPLKAEHSRCQGKGARRFVLDSEAEPFEGDVIKVLRVVAPDGYELPIGDVENPRSAFLPAPEIIQLPACEIPQLYSVMYQARHYKLRTRGEEVLSQEIYLPATLESALENFIAFSVFSNMVGQDYLIKSQEQMSLFQAAITDASSLDLFSNTKTSSHHKLEERGFV